jgi:hypothetical protein
MKRSSKAEKPAASAKKAKVSGKPAAVVAKDKAPPSAAAAVADPAVKVLYKPKGIMTSRKSQSYTPPPPPPLDMDLAKNGAPYIYLTDLHWGALHTYFDGCDGARVFFVNPDEAARLEIELQEKIRLGHNAWNINLNDFDLDGPNTSNSVTVEELVTCWRKYNFK